MTLRTSLMLVCLTTTTAVLAQAPAPQSPSPARSLPVTKVVLYKTGVGYFEHVGPIEGAEAITIQFTGAQLDDVLKSLTTVDLGNGRITGVSYDSPTPMTRRLQALRLPLGESASSVQVLAAMRGAAIEVRTSDGATHSGRLLNIERRPRTNAGVSPYTVDEVSLVTTRGDIVSVELTPGSRVTLADADLRRELDEYLNVAGSARDRDVRRMQIATAGTGGRPLFVSYVTEAAVWKTTYRLVFPEKDGAPFIQGWAIVDNMSAEDWQDVNLSLVAGAPQAFVQEISQPLFARRPVVPMPAGLIVMPQRHEATMVEGRGVVTGVARDRSGSVLHGVVVTAFDSNNTSVASAVTDGTGSYRLNGIPAGTIVVRAQLPGFTSLMRPLQMPPGGSINLPFMMNAGSVNETVTVNGGVMLTDVQSAARVQRLDREGIDNIPSGRTVQGMGQLVLGQNLHLPDASVRGFNAAQPGARQPTAVDALTVNGLSANAVAADLGDLFEYRLSDPVSIRRNGSALVPILQAPIKAERVSLWNSSMGLRPRHAVWITNTSPLTLDGGSMTIIDQGAFAGEGLIETVKPGERRLLSYGMDLGVQVKASTAPSTGRVRLLRVAAGTLTRESQHRSTVSYTIRNDNSASRIVVIEHPIRPEWQLAGEVVPSESSAGSHRFRVEVGPRETATIEVAEMQPSVTEFALAQLDATSLSTIVEGSVDRDRLEVALAPLFAARAELVSVEEERKRRETEIQSITSDQNRVRENMKALGRSAAEQRLLQRYARQLDAQETRFEELTRELNGLAADREAAQRTLQDLILTMDLEFIF